MTHFDRSIWKRRGLNLAKVAISVGLLVWILSRFPLRDIVAGLREARLAWIVLGFGFSLGSVGLLAWRWKLLLGDPTVKVRELFGWSLVGIGAGLFLPSSAAADGVKAVLYGRSARNLGRSLLSTAVGRMLGIVAILVHMVAGITLWPAARVLVSGDRAVVVGGIALVCGLVALFAYPVVARRLLVESPDESSLRGRVRRGVGYLEEMRGDLPRLFLALGASIGAQSLSFLGAWSLFQAIGAPIAVGPLFALLPVVMLGSLAPISLGGIGVREGVMIGLFTSFHLATAAVCLATSVLGYLNLGLLGLGGAGWWLLRRRAA